MIIINFFLAVNPFISAYLQSDFIGKSIFLLLIFLSILCWSVLIYLFFLTKRAKSNSSNFQKIFLQHKHVPLQVPIHTEPNQNPYLSIYSAVKKHTLDLLKKNKEYADPGAASSCLSPTDIDFVDTHAHSEISKQTQELEKNLYILSTIASLAPFLGLLGTVWGILDSFSQLHGPTSAVSSQAVLGGLSLALTTTVLGLIDAIPALIGYNFLKNQIRDFQVDMETFSNEFLASIELQYRQVDIR